MAKIYNSDLSKEMQIAGRLQTAIDKIPNELADKILPVIEVNPKLVRNQVVLGSITKSTTGSQTVFTTSSTKDTFITGFIFSINKDAICDVATGGLSWTATIDETNASTVFCRIANLTTTAQSENINITFLRPIKLARNTAVSITNDAYAVGLMSRSLTVFGYTEDNPNA